MKILKQDEFFERFNDNGLTYQAWLDTIEKESNKEMIHKHFTRSSFLKDDIKSKLSNLRYQIYILAIIAEWCGDCHRAIPILVHIADLSPKIDVKFLIKEVNMDILWTTNGGEKIPFVLFYGQDGHLNATWVERPTIAYKKLAELFEEIGFEDNAKITEGWRKIFTENQESFYQSTAYEILEIMERVNVIQGTSRRINSM